MTTVGSFWDGQDNRKYPFKSIKGKGYTEEHLEYVTLSTCLQQGIALVFRRLYHAEQILMWGVTPISRRVWPDSDTDIDVNTDTTVILPALQREVRPRKQWSPGHEVLGTRQMIQEWVQVTTHCLCTRWLHAPDIYIDVDKYDQHPKLGMSCWVGWLFDRKKASSKLFRTRL